MNGSVSARKIGFVYLPSGSEDVGPRGASHHPTQIRSYISPLWFVRPFSTSISSRIDGRYWVSSLVWRKDIRKIYFLRKVVTRRAPTLRLHLCRRWWSTRHTHAVTHHPSSQAFCHTLALVLPMIFFPFIHFNDILEFEEIYMRVTCFYTRYKFFSVAHACCHCHTQAHCTDTGGIPEDKKMTSLWLIFHL